MSFCFFNFVFVVKQNSIFFAKRNKNFVLISFPFLFVDQQFFYGWNRKLSQVTSFIACFVFYFFSLFDLIIEQKANIWTFDGDVWCLCEMNYEKVSLLYDRGKLFYYLFYQTLSLFSSRSYIYSKPNLILSFIYPNLGSMVKFILTARKLVDYLF